MRENIGLSAPEIRPVSALSRLEREAHRASSRTRATASAAMASAAKTIHRFA